MSSRAVGLSILFALISVPAAAAQTVCSPFTVATTPNPTGSSMARLEAVAVLSDTDVWAVGQAFVQTAVSLEARTVTMHWNGSAWAIVPSPSPSPYPGGGYCELLAVEAVSPGDVWAAGHQRIAGPGGYVGTHLLVMRWDGSSWAVVPAPLTNGGSGNFIDDIEVVAPNDIWFVGDWLDVSPTTAANKVALAMHWDGSGFTVVPTPFFNNNEGHGLTSVSAVSFDDVWAVGGGHDGDYVAFSYIIHWDGSTWTHVPGPTPGIAQRLYAVEAISSNDVWAAGDYYDGSGYHLLMLHWNGSSWTQVQAPGGSSALKAYGPADVYAADNAVYHFDGVTWTLVESFASVPGYEAVRDLGGVNCGNLWAVGQTAQATGFAPFSAHHSGAWTALGGAIAGSSGVPLLTGSGSPSPGALVTVTLSQARNSSPAILMIGTSALNLPAFGGILVPNPELVLDGFVTQNGGFSFGVVWPASFPSGPLYLQAALADPVAVQGIAASNGLVLLVP